MTRVVVVGAGSAGAVIASRLSEDPALQVTLLEAGPGRPPRESLVPAAFSRLFRGPADWAFHTEPEDALAGRRLYWPRGRMLGGSSAMNAMIWTPPAREDFAAWERAGCAGWGWDDVAPALARAALPPETPPRAARVGITVSRLRSPNPLALAFVDACLEGGLPPNDGFGDGRLDGAGLFRVTQARGRRISSAAGFLAPVRRPNLRIVTGAVATGVRLEGRRATGVRFRRAGATAEDLAPGAVVLAAGAIGSPHLLLLSGIGPAAALRRHGVAVACDLPGVGRNLQDHLAIGAMYRCRAPVTLAGAGRPGAVAAYLLRRRGLLTSNVAEAGAFLRLAPTAPAPDMELLIGVSYFLEHGFANPEGHGFTVAAILQHPASRGELTLASADPARAPVIRPHYLSAGSDLPRLVEGLELARSLVRRRAFDRFRGGEVLPDPATDPEAHVRTRSETLYHPVGTCRMGTDDEAVVTPSLGVHGLEDLWVADASVMPLIPTAHPHAAVVAIAERAAGFVRAALAGVSP